MASLLAIATLSRLKTAQVPSRVKVPISVLHQTTFVDFTILSLRTSTLLDANGLKSFLSLKVFRFLTT